MYYRHGVPANVVKFDPNAKRKQAAIAMRDKVRDTLVERLDKVFANRIEAILDTKLRMVVSAAWDNDELRTRETVSGFVLAVFQEVQYALFPEAFDDDPEVETAKYSVLPDSLQRVSLDGLALLAEAIRNADAD